MSYEHSKQAQRFAQESVKYDIKLFKLPALNLLNLCNLWFV